MEEGGVFIGHICEPSSIAALRQAVFEDYLEGMVGGPYYLDQVLVASVGLSNANFSSVGSLPIDSGVGGDGGVAIGQAGDPFTHAFNDTFAGNTLGNSFPGGIGELVKWLVKGGGAVAISAAASAPSISTSGYGGASASLFADNSAAAPITAPPALSLFEQSHRRALPLQGSGGESGTEASYGKKWDNAALASAPPGQHRRRLALKMKSSSAPSSDFPGITLIVRLSLNILLPAGASGAPPSPLNVSSSFPGAPAGAGAGAGGAAGTVDSRSSRRSQQRHLEPSSVADTLLASLKDPSASFAFCAKSLSVLENASGNALNLSSVTSRIDPSTVALVTLQYEVSFWALALEWLKRNALNVLLGGGFVAAFGLGLGWLSSARKRRREAYAARAEDAKKVRLKALWEEVRLSIVAGEAGRREHWKRVRRSLLHWARICAAQRALNGLTLAERGRGGAAGYLEDLLTPTVLRKEGGWKGTAIASRRAPPLLPLAGGVVGDEPLLAAGARTLTGNARIVSDPQASARTQSGGGGDNAHDAKEMPAMRGVAAARTSGRSIASPAPLQKGGRGAKAAASARKNYFSPALPAKKR